MKKKVDIFHNKDRHGYNEDVKVFYDQIIDSSRSMISIINKDYIYERVNQTFCNAHKVSSDAFVGKSLGEVWGDNIFKNVIKKNIDLCFRGNTVRYEAEFEISPHGKRYFDVIFRPLPSESGKITHVLAETFDINDLKLSEQKAIQKENEYRNLETNLPIGFIRCDIKGNIINANRTFLQLMGYSEEESAVMNTSINVFYTSGTTFEYQLKNLRETGAENFGKIYMKNSAGIEIPCRVGGFLHTDFSGDPYFVDFSVEDLSKELLLENRLKQAHSLETIGVLAGGIAHDFNNILATISGYIEMISEDIQNCPDSNSISDKTSGIRKAIDRARSIIDQMLTFSRHSDQEKIHVSVAETLNDTINFIGSSIPANINIRSNTNVSDAMVFADPTQLFRVFLNLLTNAVEAMKEKGGILSVSISVVDREFLKKKLYKEFAADEYVEIVIKDTGIGMDPVVVKRIFEPFFTSKDAGKGTGLGLSVVYGIVTELEGEIFVESNKKSGSEFYLYIPVAK